MKLTHRIFTIIFMMILFLPLAFVNPYGDIVSEQENRMLAKRPATSGLFLQPADFTRQFDRWFADNVGFREQLIGLYKKLDSLETQGQYSDGSNIMLIGEQGHHYFADIGGWLIGKFQGKALLTDEQLVKLSDGLNAIQAYLNKKDIPFILMFCADKETIYPEYYPKSIIKGPDPDQLDTVSEYIMNHTNIDFFSVKACLLEAKKHYPVFDKVGDARMILSHHSEIGAFFTYQELMKHITTYMPQIKALTAEDVSFTYHDVGDYQNISDVILLQDQRYRSLDSDFFTNIPLQHPSQGSAFENDDASLPTILIMRDSYTGNGNYISRYIPQHFGKTILIHWNNTRSLTEYIDILNPDIVVFEVAERMLIDFPNAVADFHAAK